MCSYKDKVYCRNPGSVVNGRNVVIRLQANDIF
jgi:hypothetical protein